MQLVKTGLDVVERRDTPLRLPVLDVTHAQVAAFLRVDETLVAGQGQAQQPGGAEQAHHKL